MDAVQWSPSSDQIAAEYELTKAKHKLSNTALIDVLSIIFSLIDVAGKNGIVVMWFIHATV